MEPDLDAADSGTFDFAGDVEFCLGNVAARWGEMARYVLCFGDVKNTKRETGMMSLSKSKQAKGCKPKLALQTP